MMLLAPLDKLHRACPSVSLAVVVDDLMLRRVGGQQRAVREVADAAFQLKLLLEKYDLHVAVKKSRTLANVAEAREALQQRLGRPLGVVA
eukprot:4583185-Pyramimonas_sp.AAC.2